jgi:hypothetical protein
VRDLLFVRPQPNCQTVNRATLSQKCHPSARQCLHPVLGILPKDYARESLDKRRLGQLIDLIGTIGLGDKESRSAFSSLSLLRFQRILLPNYTFRLKYKARAQN